MDTLTNTTSLLILLERVAEIPSHRFRSKNGKVLFELRVQIKKDVFDISLSEISETVQEVYRSTFSKNNMNLLETVMARINRYFNANTCSCGNIIEDDHIVCIACDIKNYNEMYLEHQSEMSMMSDESYVPESESSTVAGLGAELRTRVKLENPIYKPEQRSKKTEGERKRRERAKRQAEAYQIRKAKMTDEDRHNENRKSILYDYNNGITKHPRRAMIEKYKLQYDDQKKVWY